MSLLEHTALLREHLRKTITQTKKSDKISTESTRSKECSLFSVRSHCTETYAKVKKIGMFLISIKTIYSQNCIVIIWFPSTTLNTSIARANTAAGSCFLTAVFKYLRSTNRYFCGHLGAAEQALTTTLTYYHLMKLLWGTRQETLYITNQSNMRNWWEVFSFSTNCCKYSTYHILISSTVLKWDVSALPILLVKTDSRPQLVGMFCYALLLASN